MVNIAIHLSYIRRLQSVLDKFIYSGEKTKRLMKGTIMGQVRRGLMIILSSPSGAGKSTLAKMLLGWSDQMQFSVSATTRPPREGEKDGVDYHFRSNDDALFCRLSWPLPLIKMNLKAEWVQRGSSKVSHRNPWTKCHPEPPWLLSSLPLSWNAVSVLLVVCHS